MPSHAVPHVMFMPKRDPLNSSDEAQYKQVEKLADFSYLSVVRIKNTNSLGVVMRITPYWKSDEDQETEDDWLGWVYSVYVQRSPKESADYGVHALEAIYNEDCASKNLKGIRATPAVNPMEEDNIIVNSIELDGDEQFNLFIMKLPNEEPYRSDFLNQWKNNMLIEGPFGFQQGDLSEDKDAEESIVVTYVPGLENASLDIEYQ